MKELYIKITIFSDDDPWVVGDGLELVTDRIGQGQLKGEGDCELFTYSYELTTFKEEDY